MTTQRHRSVQHHLSGIPGDVGGFSVQRMSPRTGSDMVDPFLFLDFFDTKVPPNFPSGHNAHPHRGFETVSVVMHGEIGYRDSLGNRGVLKSGSVEWMTAGKGIVHDAHDDHEFARTGGGVMGLQLWVNLPARLKMMDPAARYIAPDEIPTQAISGGLARVIAGSAHGIESPHKTHVPLLLVDYAIERDATVRLPLAADWNSLLLVCQGALRIAGHDREVRAGEYVRLNNDGPAAVFTGVTESTRVFVGAGEPIGEPVASWGPFVINSQEEIVKARRDYSAGLMGSVRTKSRVRGG